MYWGEHAGLLNFKNIRETGQCNKIKTKNMATQWCHKIVTLSLLERCWLLYYGLRLHEKIVLSWSDKTSRQSEIISIIAKMHFINICPLFIFTSHLSSTLFHHVIGRRKMSQDNFLPLAAIKTYILYNQIKI